MKQFVGFGTSTEFLRCIDKESPVNAECVTELGKGGKYGIRLATTSIILSQTQNGEVLYFLAPVTRYQTMDTQPMFGEEDKHHLRGKTAYCTTLSWLADNGVEARKAMVAMPTNLRKLEGVAEYMRYDKESDSYIRISEDNEERQ